MPSRNLVGFTHRVVSGLVFCRLRTNRPCRKTALLHYGPAQTRIGVATQTIDSALADRTESSQSSPRVVRSGRARRLTPAHRNASRRRSTTGLQFCVARIFTVVRDAKLDPWTQPMRVGREWRVHSHVEARSAARVEPRSLRLDPADELDFKAPM